MKLIIYCTEPQAQVICHALQDMHEKSKKLKLSGQALQNAESMKRCAEILAHGLLLSIGEEDTITMRI